MVHICDVYLGVVFHLLFIEYSIFIERTKEMFLEQSNNETHLQLVRSFIRLFVAHFSGCVILFDIKKRIHNVNIIHIYFWTDFGAIWAAFCIQS